MKNIVFGEKVLQSDNFSIMLEGTVSVAPVLIVKAAGGSVGNFRIFFDNPNANTVDSLGIAFTENLPGLDEHDYLRIVCERGRKSIKKYDAKMNSWLNYAGTLAIDSAWPILSPGINLLSYIAESGHEHVRFSYEYDLLYSGI